jgi:hypothetical protein
MLFLVISTVCLKKTRRQAQDRSMHPSASRRHGPAWEPCIGTRARGAYNVKI